MLALAAHRDSLCPNCGGHLADTTAPENARQYKAELPTKCFRCEAFSISHDAYTEQPHPMSYLHEVPFKPKRR